MTIHGREIASAAAGRGDHLSEVASLAARSKLVAERPGLFVRWSKGPEHDGDERSTDYATGLTLPGLAVSPLTPPHMVDAACRGSRPTTRRPAAGGWPRCKWVARQVRAYAHLADDQPDNLA
jgi:hypothetical protein